ncbi:hypothetical protein KFE25_005978 [Diacronema lutheri]|uniref:serine C-palmitoyltransferase n=4 Tax=Diacronema lutheri TaxID=2081491 RepID=A0A8J6CJ43_DIALT|nr:hypothetical protein KFE25_005978 [Diacronema lutheri]
MYVLSGGAALLVCGATVVLLVRARRPAVAMPADFHQLRPPRATLVSAILMYVYLVCRALTLDFLDRVLAFLPGGAGGVQAARGPSRRGPPLKSGMQDLYERRFFSWIADTFNRPITGEAGGTVLVKERAFNRATGEHEMTGRDLRCINLGSYNYLGFGGCDEICTPAVLRSVDEHGTSTGAPRAECGTRDVHLELERAIAMFLGKEAAVTMGMGFATNSTMIPIIVDADGDGAGVLLLSDALNHSSIVEGVRSSGASVLPFVHNSMIDLEDKLRTARLRGQPGCGRPWRKVIVVVEGIYSMEGELCPLRQIVALKKAYGAYLYLDEAHSIGAVGPTGRGVAELLGVPTSEIDVMMGTFTKSFGSVGGYVAAARPVVDALRARSHGTLHACAMSPPAVQQVLSSLRVISQADGADSPSGALGRAKLRALAENVRFFRDGLIKMGCEVLGDDGSPVVPIMIYHLIKMRDFSRQLLARGIAVVIVGYPASPMLFERARFCVSAAHTREDLTYALRCIEEVAAGLGMLYHADASGQAERAAAAVAKAHRLRTAPLALDERALAHIRATLPAWTAEPLCGAECATRDAARAPSAAAVLTALPAGTSVALAACDPLGIRQLPRLREVAAETIRAYGVGTCGPRAFYGTLDVHLQLESQLAAFLGTELAIIYSSAVATFSSMLPALAKRTDTVFVDDGAHAVARVRMGIDLSRARVRVYARGDMGALRTLLLEQDAIDARLPSSKHGRRLIVTEGVCAATGAIAPLPELLQLRDEHGAYLVVDESLSLGVLGARGRGVAEHYGLPSSCIDAIVGSLEHALSSVGGFCAGSAQAVRQQRLFATGYIFSASLPAYCAAVAAEALRTLEREPWRAHAARAASAALRAELERSGAPAARALVLSGGEAGCVHVRAPGAGASAAAQRAALGRVAARVLASYKMVLTVLPVELAEPERPPADDGAGGASAGGAARVAPPRASASAAARTRAAPLPSLRLSPMGLLTPVQIACAAKAISIALLDELPAPVPGSPLALKPPALRANGAAVDTAALHAPQQPPAVASRGARARDASDTSSSDGGDGASDGALSGGEEGACAAARRDAPIADGGKRAARDAPAGGAADIALVRVDTPIGLALSFARRALRAYLAKQAEWGVRTIVMPVSRRARASASASTVFWAMSLLGSEAFYVATFPALIWAEAAAGSEGGASLARTLVLFFSASVVVGNVLKVALALPRPNVHLGSDAAALPPADEGWNRDFAWPSIAAMNAIGLPFFVLRYHFGGTYLWSQTDPAATVLCYAAAFLWAAGICGSRLVAAAASPADVQGGMMIGALLVRLGLPRHETLSLWLARPDATVLGCAPELALPLLALCAMLLHPVTPTDQRGAYSVTNSAKAVGFACAFALGSRARLLETERAHASMHAARAAFSGCAYAFHAIGGLLLMAAILAATHSARRAAVRSASRTLGLAGKVVACGMEYYLLGQLVALWVPRALDAGAIAGHAAAHLVLF